MRYVLVAVAISVLGGSYACHGSNEPRVASAVSGLPEYTPEEASAFDDVLAPAIFGLRADVQPEKDPGFNARLSAADWVSRARISTVSKETLAGKDGYTLSLSPEGDVLAGNQSPSTIELRVPQGSPSYVRLETAGPSLAGKRVIVFVRRYADRGEPVSHWHAEVNDETISGAIARAKAARRAGNEGAH